MRKGKSVIGKPILSLEDATRLYEVKDLILGTGNDTVVGLIAEEGGIFSSSLVVPIDQVTGFGRDAVVVRNRESVIPANESAAIQPVLERKTSLLGTKVYTETGDDQGKVSDVYFEETSGRVMGFELSGGMLADAAQGARFVPIEELVRAGPDVVYVHPETADLLEQQRGGISGALADASDTARDGATTVKGKVGDAAGGARGSMAEAKPEESLVGKRTGRDVDEDSGSVLVPAGRRVTLDDVERARSAGKLSDLTTAVGMGEAGLAAAGAKDNVGNIGDSAGSLWDQFTRKLGEMTDATGQRVGEEQTKRRLSQIEDAVGRPVTKVILDLEDTVILDLGDLITHAAVQRAHDAGTLDSLLDSVYKGEVTFGRDEMRAEKPGAAALEVASRPGVSAPIVEELRSQVDDAERARAEESQAKKQKAEQDRVRRDTERTQRSRERDTAAQERDTDGVAAESV
ncbi:MAG: PRC-barrel domain-containing protein [Chloroflexota bacterium]